MSTREDMLMQLKLFFFFLITLYRQNLLNITVSNLYTANKKSNSSSTVQKIKIDIDSALVILARVALTLILFF